MRKQIALSGVALTALLLAIVPAGAVSLTIGGGGGLISVDGSSDSSTSSSGGVSVDIGGDADASVDLDADVDVDLGGEGDATFDLFGGKKKLLTTGGDNLVTVDTSEDADALITLFGSGSGAGGAGVDIDVDLSGGSEDEVSVGLFGGSDAGGSDLTVDLLGGAEGDALVSLFGTGGVGGGTGSSGDGLGFGVPDEAAIAIFGPSDGDEVDNTQTGSIGNSGSGAGPSSAAGPGTGGSGRSGGDMTADDGRTIAPTPAMPARIAPQATTRIAANAAAQARASCFSPDDEQIAYLRGRATYDGSVAATWKSAANISIVPINLCPDAKARLAAAVEADANIQYLQAAVAADPRLKSSLRPSYDPDDVLAVDKAGDGLTVYVY